jgi:hypothetical protein
MTKGILESRGPLLPPIYVREIQRGQDFRIILRGAAGYYAQFGIIQADFKTSASLKGKSVLSYSLGSGIVISGTDLILTIPEAVTANLQQGTLHADIKGRIGSASPVIFLTGRFPVSETITNIPLPTP